MNTNTALLRFFCGAFCFFLCTSALRAQTALDRQVSGEYHGGTLIEMLLDIEKRFPPTRFYYEPSELPYYAIDYKIENQTLFGVLKSVLGQNELSFAAVGNDGVVIMKKTNMNKAYINRLVQKWKDGKVEMPDFLQPLSMSRTCGDAVSAAGNAPRNVTLLCLDENSRESISAASIRINAYDSTLYKGKTGAVSNGLGQATLKLPSGDYTLNIRYVGYRETIVQLRVFSDGNVTVPMQQNLLSLQEVVVEGNRAADKVSTTAVGVEAISSKTMKELPALMGEADLIKSLQVLPGVSTVGEGASGFNVRGGSIDQNLVQQDGLMLFNTSHVLGFFSVFNPDIVGKTTLYKGHIPAQFGGRIASVLDVQLRDPDFNTIHGSVTAGLQSSKLSLELPILKNRVSLLVGARSSFSDWLLKTARLPDVRQSSAWFADGTLKLAAKLGANGKLDASWHQSADYFRFSKEFGFEWATKGASLNYKQALREKLLLNLHGSMGQLNNRYFIPEGTQAFNLDTRLRYQKAKAILTYLPQNHEVKLGLEWSGTQNAPQILSQRDVSSILPKTIAQDRGAEQSVFLEDEWKLSPRWSLSAGLRYTLFQQLGEAAQFQYEPNGPIVTSAITDTVFFGKNQKVQQYKGFEPRLALNYRLDEGQSIKASYNRLRQYIHLISNTTAATPSDVWQVSTRYIPPQTGDNFSAGYYRNLQRRVWETSVELFYKTVQNLPSYRDFARLTLNQHLETELLAGKLRSMGVEYSLRKKEGRLSGALAYTFSRSFQLAPSPFVALSVNQNRWFPANYDQPHQANLYVKWMRNPARYWTANFAYRTGRPVSAPESGYVTGNNIVVPFFEGRNNLRIPDYHRLDVGYTIDRSKASLSRISWLLNLSIYNVYARQNPFSVYFKRDKNGVPKAYQLSAIGAAIPSVNFTLIW